MKRLLVNEFVKFINRNYVIMVVTSIMVVVFIYGINMYNNQAETFLPDFWQEIYMTDVDNTLSFLENNSISMAPKLVKMYEAEVQIKQYHLDNNIPPLPDRSASRFVLKVNNVFLVVTLLVIILSCTIITDEYSSKSIYNLLAFPVFRSKLLSAKIAVVFITSILIMLIFLVVSIGIGWGLFGYDDFSGSVIIIEGGKVIQRSVQAQALLGFGYNSVSLIISSVLGILASILIKRSSISVPATMLTVLFGYKIAEQLMDYPFVKFTIFPHINFADYLSGTQLFESMKPIQSIGILSLHLILFLGISFYVFCNQDY